MEKNIEFRSFCRFRDGKNIHTQKKPINWMRDVEILHICMTHKIHTILCMQRLVKLCNRSLLPAPAPGLAEDHSELRPQVTPTDKPQIRAGNSETKD